jgi:hypothetical protein
LHLRVPSWCAEGGVAINGESAAAKKGGSIVRLRRRWRPGDRVELTLPMRLAVSRWHKGAVAVERGPLLLALRIGERWVEVDNTDSYGPYRECHPTGRWDFGLIETQLRELDKHFKVTKKPGSLAANPWTLAGAPIEIHTQGRRIDDWKLVNQTAAPLPESPVRLPVSVRPEPVVLIPYGCTTLRIAEFPVVR